MILQSYLHETLGIEFTQKSTTHLEAIMPITERIMQPFGFVHGGATAALLEGVASMGAILMADLSKERAFGVEARIRHRKSGVSGTLRGVATLNHCEGSDQYWDVAAYDDEGDVISEGVFITKIVSLERLAEKERKRAATRKQQPASSQAELISSEA